MAGIRKPAPDSRRLGGQARPIRRRLPVPSDHTMGAYQELWQQVNDLAYSGHGALARGFLLAAYPPRDPIRNHCARHLRVWFRRGGGSNYPEALEALNRGQRW